MQNFKYSGTFRALLFMLAFGLHGDVQTITSGGLIFSRIEPNLPTTPGYITKMKQYSVGAVLLWGDVATQAHTLYDMSAVTHNVTLVVKDGDPNINGDFIFDWQPSTTGTSFNSMTLAIQNMQYSPNYSANWWYDKASGNITRYYGSSDTITLQTAAGIIKGKPWRSTTVGVCPTPTGNVHCAIVGLIDPGNQKPDLTKFIYQGMANIDTTPWQSLTQLTNLQIGNVGGGSIYFPFEFTVFADGFDFVETDPAVGGVSQRYNKIVHAKWDGTQSVPFGNGIALDDGQTCITWSDVTQVPLDNNNYIVSVQTELGRQVVRINDGVASVISKNTDYTAQPAGFTTVPSYGSPYFLGQNVYLGNAVMSLTGNGQMFLFGNGDKMPDGTSVAIMDGFNTGGNGAVIYGRDSGGTNFWWWQATVSPPVNAQPPVVQLTASTTIVDPGQPVTLNWAATNANTVMLTPGFGQVGMTGSQEVDPSATTTYSVTAVGTGGVTTVDVTVVVITERRIHPPLKPNK